MDAAEGPLWPHTRAIYCLVVAYDKFDEAFAAFS